MYAMAARSRRRSVPRSGGHKYPRSARVGETLREIIAEELVRIANLYFEGIEKSSGDIIPLVSETSRVENGFRTAPRPPATDGKPAQSIQETFNSGMFQYIREIRPRRFLLVDEERAKLEQWLRAVGSRAGDRLTAP